jgi:hypothetical protein
MLITEFLEARIAEDEATCKGMLTLVPTPDDSLENGWDFAYAERVLAECAAKRAVIGLAQKATEDEKAFDDYEWQGTVDRSEPWTGDAILYALASVYADHPDYLPEWKP